MRHRVTILRKAATSQLRPCLPFVILALSLAGAYAAVALAAWAYFAFRPGHNELQQPPPAPAA